MDNDRNQPHGWKTMKMVAEIEHFSGKGLGESKVLIFTGTAVLFLLLIGYFL